MKGLFREKPITMILIIANALVFIATVIVEKVVGTYPFLIMGASYAPLIANEGEYYRLFTCMFVHFDFLHLFSNMLLLFFIGEILEKIAGKVRYLIIYFAGGLIASIVSVILELKKLEVNMPISAGASGAIFALLGALVCLVLMNRGQLAGMTTDRLLLMVGLSLWQGFRSTNVDNAAHVSGLIAGFILGTIVFSIRGGIRKNKRRRAEPNGLDYWKK